MADLSLSVVVSRTLLGLADLNINDHTNYYVAAQFLGGNVAWQRNQVGSPWLDGQVTVNRQMQMVSEQIAIEVLGTTQPVLQTNLSTLIEAFSQDAYTIVATIGSTAYEYQCESADYQVAWQGPRFVAKQIQVVFTVPRQPVPIIGGV